MEQGLNPYIFPGLEQAKPRKNTGKLGKYWDKAQTLPAPQSQVEANKRRQLIAGELAILQVAYPTQSRNFTKQEIETTNALWLEVFGRVPPQLLHAAIQRFILEDRKGFFPAPGQIVGNIEKIVLEIETTKNLEIEEAYTKRIMDEWQKQKREEEEKNAERKRISEPRHDVRGAS